MSSKLRKIAELAKIVAIKALAIIAGMAGISLGWVCGLSFVFNRNFFAHPMDSLQQLAHNGVLYTLRELVNAAPEGMPSRVMLALMLILISYIFSLGFSEYLSNRVSLISWLNKQTLSEKDS